MSEVAWVYHVTNFRQIKSDLYDSKFRLKQFHEKIAHFSEIFLFLFFFNEKKTNLQTSQFSLNFAPSRQGSMVRHVLDIDAILDEFA